MAGANIANDRLKTKFTVHLIFLLHEEDSVVVL